MNKEELQRNVTAVVESALGEQINLERLGLERIEPGASLIDDLGIDSVDLLTVIYDIEVALKKDLPISEWLGKASGADSGAFTVEALVNHIVDFIHPASAEAV